MVPCSLMEGEHVMLHDVFSNPDFQSIVVFLEEYRDVLENMIVKSKRLKVDPMFEKWEEPYTSPFTSTFITS